MSKKVYRAKRQGNLLWVRAAVGVNGSQPIILRLLIATGSSFTVLPTTVVESLGCDLSQPLTRLVVFAAGGRLVSPIVSLPWFDCLGKSLENLPVAAFNLPSGVFVDGLLGMDFLRRFQATIDIGKLTILLSNEID